MIKIIKEAKSWKDETVIYGVTDRTNDSLLKKINDSLIDLSPIREKEKGMFFISLHLLIGSGVNIVRTLEILSERQKNTHFKRVLSTILYDIKKGNSLSSALEKHPKVFKKAEIGIIRAGELSGKIEQNIGNVAEQIAKNIEIKLRIQSALVYPFAVFLTMILSLAIILTVVVPQFRELFAEFPNEELPFSTKIIIVSSEILIEFWWIILTLGLGLFFIAKNWANSKKGKPQIEKIIMTLPGIKRIIGLSQTIEISRNLCFFIESEIPILKALSALREIVKSENISSALMKARQEISEGKRIFEAFRENKTFDPVIGEVLEIGEQNGKMSEMLKKVATQYELEVDAELKNLSVILEPTMIILMGCAVIFIAFAILTPIFELQTLISSQ